VGSIASRGQLCHKLPKTTKKEHEMSRVTINISVPESMRNYIDSRVAAADYGSVSEYFRELFRQDRERQFELGRILAAHSSTGPVQRHTPQATADIKSYRALASAARRFK